MIESELQDSESSLQFLSTQIQSVYERDEARESASRKTSESISQLQHFSNATTKKQPKGTVKKTIIKPFQRSKKAPRTNKIHSLTSHVQDIFGRTPITDFSDQHSILSYFSTKKHKIQHILHTLEKDSNDAASNRNFTRNIGSVIPYNREEWAEITDAIKENLPNLSDATMRTLKTITRRIENQTSLDPDAPQIPESISLWDQASHHPSIPLTPSDIRTLYDLNSDQMAQDTSFIEEEEIPDSCSEPEILEITSEDIGISSRQPIQDIDTKINVLDSMNSLKFPAPQSKDDFVEEEVAEISSETEPLAEEMALEVLSSSQSMNDQEVIISSSVRSSSVSSRLATPKKSKLAFNISPLKLTPPNFSSSFETDSVYATAVSSFHHTQLCNSPPKKYNTRTIEMDGEINIREVDSDHIKIRKIGQRQKSVGEDEVEDSDDDAVNISIIELSTLVEESEEESMVGQLIAKADRSVIQVPSSPDIGAVTLSQRNPSEFSQMSAKELRGVFKDWQLKPVKTKEKMIEILENASEIIDSQNPSQLTQTEFNEQVFQKLSEAIKNNHEWLEKINSYEPILIEKLKAWLDTETIICEPDLLEKFCDFKGICYTNKDKE
ncbi:5'-flap endonuclease [Yamadazyma tenuis]|nr:5'-flap endonuclease [Yamadazyma tenuis]